MQSGSFLNWHSLYQYKYRLPFNNGYHLHYPSSDQTENYNQNDAWKTMDRLLEQCKFNIYSKSLYNSRLLSDQNQVVLIYLATISFSIKFMLLSYEKKKKILRQQGGWHSPPGSFVLFQFLFQARIFVKASFKEQFTTNSGISNFSSKTDSKKQTKNTPAQS